MLIDDECLCGAVFSVAGSFADCAAIHGRWITAHRVCREQAAPDAASAASEDQHSEPGRVSDSVVEAMVNRFLAWDLPEGFTPDGGIDFKPPDTWAEWPTGTNLFSHTEAEHMVRHMLATAPAPDADEKE